MKKDDKISKSFAKGEIVGEDNSLIYFSKPTEIGGGYLIWLWLREGYSSLRGLPGGVALVLYGIIATLQVYPDFGRVYAAYGGVFVVMSVL
jgi:drug/metabolite transporter superfamily protein YnfA